MSAVGTEIAFGLELDPKTAVALTRFARRRRRLLLLRAAAAGLLFFIATMTIVAVCDYVWLLNEPLRWMLSIVAYAITGVAMWWFGFRHFDHGDPREVARQLESADPRLREDLLSAVELADPVEVNGSFGFRHLLQRSVARRASGLDIGRLLPIGLIERWLISGLVLLSICAGLMLIPRMQFGRRIARAMLPGAPIQRASLTDLQIIKPSPPSGYVAEGDAVGVTAEVTGSSRHEVWLQWRTDEAEGETPMTPRIADAASHSDGTLGHQGVYSANVSVGSVPLEYRVIAGDAVSLWHELTPLPRPHVTSFTKRYVFPSYSKLPERVEESEHGDVKALVGTMAHVTVRFDQPVTDAVVQYGNRGATTTMDPVAGSDREFLASIPVRTPTTYQVDATSRESGLSNPFSPQYAVTPIIDTAPVIRWDESVPKTMIVSPLDVIPLSATANDDLPLERVVHEFQINDTVVERRQLPIDEPSREVKLSWDWDLMHRMAGAVPSEKLRSGDMIRMRLVAIDRKGERGNSTFVEVLVAEEGFDGDRHFRTHQLRHWTESVTQWVERSRELMSLMRLSAEQSDWPQIDTGAEQVLTLLDDYRAVEELTSETISGAQHHAEAATIELIGRALHDHRTKLKNWFDDAASMKGNVKPRELIEQAKRLTAEGSRIDQWSRATIAEYLTAAVVKDAMALDRSLNPMTDRDNPLPPERFPRYLAVTIGRMQGVGELIDGFESVLPESTIRHLEVWHRMSSNWQSRLDDLMRRPVSDANPAIVQDFQNELRRVTAQSMVDGRVSPTVVNMVRDVRFQVAGTGDQIFAIDRVGRQAQTLRDRAAAATDSAEVASLNQQVADANKNYSRSRDDLLARLDAEEALHRRRPFVDLQYAADLDLIRRALENVTMDGYQPYKEITAPEVHQKLARAFQVIEASHEASVWLNELRALLLAERQLDENEVTKILHPTWIERLPTGLDWPARTIQNLGIGEVFQAIDRVRYGDAYNRARSRITQRRWSAEPMLSAENQIDELQQQLADAIRPMEVRVIEARETIEQFVLSLSEQARQAAEEAREAEQVNRARDESDQQTVDELQGEHDEAVEAATETIESLMDYANTIDLTDAEQRELARDADAASAKIQSDMQRAEEAMEKAEKAPSDAERSEALDQAADAMKDLAASLDETADHFEQAESGQDVSESRQALREAEAALRMQQEMQEPYDRTEALAEAMQDSPQELLERLERELHDNEPMQEELSEIAEQATENAARTLEQSAEEERGLNQSMQRSDGAFQEQKRRIADQLNNLARRTDTVNDSLLAATERAIGWANAPEWRPKLDEARDQLRASTQQVNELGGENAVLRDMQQAANQMSQAMQEASELIDEVNQMADQAQEDNLHQDESGRKRAIDQLERVMRDARAQQLRASNEERQRWSASKRNAARRVQQAQRQKRDAENRKRQLEDRIKREPNNARSIEPQLATAQQQVEDARRKEDAARASVEFADSMLKDSEQRGNELKRQQIGKLEQNNPAAEMAVQMTNQADSELKSIQGELDRMADDASFDDELRLPTNQTQNLVNQQARIAGDISEAVEQLQRAARHEERLGRAQLADQLDQVAQMVQNQAADAADAATEALQLARDDDQQSPQADSQVAQAADQIQQAADQLAQLLQNSMPSQASDQAASAQDSGEQLRGQQLARTLDELDRALNQSSPGEPQSGQPGTEQQAGNPAEGQQPSEGQPGDGQPQTAGEASPTLSEALAQQAQNAARQRGQQLQPSSQGQAQSSNQSQSASSSDASSEPGGGNMPDGGFVETMGIERLGSDWGALRQRRTEDATQSRGATIAPQYRREVEAYFRAVARQAAESGEQP